MPFSALHVTGGPPQFRTDDISDPLTRKLIESRRDETEDQRMRREYAEREALKRSKEIDEWLKVSKLKERKKRKIAKVLLVGQSESGKSTTLKNFQLHYAPKAFQAERGRWKTVILLNLIRSLRKIHEALTNYVTPQTRTVTYPITHPNPVTTSIEQKASVESSEKPPLDEDGEEYDVGIPPHRRRPKLTPQHRLLLLRLRPALSLETQLLHALATDRLQNSQSTSSNQSNTQASSHLDWYTAWQNEVPDDYHAWTPPSSTGSSSLPSSSPHTPTSLPSISPFILSDEVVVPAGWNQFRSRPPSPPNELDNLVEFVSGRDLTGSPDNGRYTTRFPRRQRSGSQPVKSSTLSKNMATLDPLPDAEGATPIDHGEIYCGKPIQTDIALGDNTIPPISPPPPNGSTRSIARSPTPSSIAHHGDVPERVLAACAEDILTLWKDEVVRTLLCGPLSRGGLGLRLHEDAGFFLDDVERITAPSYIPTDDDILRARLKTMGVSEHRFVIEDSTDMDNDYVSEMVVYDVGGARTQRHQWMNYFEDINVIIFLAPISAFDQRLVEDPSVNRLQDTFNLWKEVTKSKLLAKVDFLIFLNKCDLLQGKMKAGIPLRKFIPQFTGDNTVVEALRFFRNVFSNIWHKNSAPFKQPAKYNRTLYIHSTSMIDIKTSKVVIQSVQNCAFRTNLKEAMVI